MATCVCAVALSSAAHGQTRIPPLVEAARHQDLATVSQLLTASSETNVNASQPDGATALHWAVHWEHVEMTGRLIGAGADVNVHNDLGMFPLLMAGRAGNATLVQHLLAAGADPDQSLESGETALMAAARVGGHGAVTALLAHSASPNLAETTRGQSALMWAVANRRPAVTEVLLRHGADIHARSRARRLVFSMGGSRSAGSASRGISLEEVEQGGSTPLLFAARSGDLASARLLVKAGADVENTAADGNPALVVAAHSGQASLAAFLLDEGADPNAAPLGYTALHAAVLRGALDDRGVVNPDPGAGLTLVRALLVHGADPNPHLSHGTPVRRWSHDFAFMERWSGATPFWLAAMFLEVDMMRLLVEFGADPLLPSHDGTTPLMAAAGLGYSRGGGSAFIKDRRDFSSYNPVASAELGSRIPAHEERQALTAVAMALELGAEMNATNDSGNTALHAAAGQGTDTVVAFLIEQGADVTLANGRGQTARELAVFADGIAGDSFVRESTAELLDLGRRNETMHPASPHRHPVAQSLVNPVAGTRESLAAGSATYATLCSACHGPTGSGDGPLAAATGAYGSRPSNLRDGSWQHGPSDGEIFATIRDGIAPTYSMDAYRGRLSEPEIWNLVNYLRTLGPQP